jgi:tetratricopeptide (TPR) repeat protein
MDYAPGTDISFYKNIPVPTSYMAIKSGYDFVGGYEHDTECGILHVANHHISPGKKQWTWGNGDFGQTWDRNLTDEDGPYIELMTGVFTDNQPDFSWLQPNEEKTFEQYFMPYHKAGLVKNATKDAAINVTIQEKNISLVVYSTGIFPSSTITVFNKQCQIIKTYKSDLSPLEVFEVSFESASELAIHDLVVKVVSAGGNELVGLKFENTEKPEIPSAASPAKLPSEISSIEDLYLNGLHIEQYRHATYQAADYYQEALRREPGDTRCNNAMGLLLLRSGQFSKAEPYFRKAITTVTGRNPNPYDGEAYYNLGITLQFQGKLDDAYAAFYKATWNDAWQHNGFLQLARIDATKNNFTEAIALVEKSLIKNYHSHSARHLKSFILRKLGKQKEAASWINASLEIDPFNYGCRFESYLLSIENGDNVNAETQLNDLKHLMRDAANNYLEYGFDYAAAGAYKEAIALLNIYVNNSPAVYPVALYAMSYFAAKTGDHDASVQFAQQAYNCSTDYCFPNKLEEINVLKYAIDANPSDDKACYYLGNLWFGMRQYPEATNAFEKSVEINPLFPTAHRNLSLLYFNKQGNAQKALIALETAFSLDKHDSRVLMELDQLRKRLNTPLKQRLKSLNEFEQLTLQRDDLFLERITLENNLGNFGIAKKMLEERIFHPWEGGEGKVVSQYLTCHIELAKEAMLQNEFEKALCLLDAARLYPCKPWRRKINRYARK